MDVAVGAAIHEKILPRWADLDTLAKELIVLHALNTNAATWDMVLGRGECTEAFRGPLALLCENHLLEQVADEDFVRNANLAYERLKL